MSNAEIRGRFVWHELMTTDPQAAGTFYSKVLPWKTQPSGMPDLPSPISDTDLNPTELRVAVGADGAVEHVLVEQSCGSGRLDLDQQAALPSLSLSGAINVPTVDGQLGYSPAVDAFVNRSGSRARGPRLLAQVTLLAP